MLRPSKLQTVINCGAETANGNKYAAANGKSTRTPEVVGSKPRGPLDLPLATRETTVLLLKRLWRARKSSGSSAFSGAGLAIQAESARGSEAALVAAGGEVAGETQTKSNLVERCR